MNKYDFELETVNICPKCKSDNVFNRFTNAEDTEDYHFHHDTLKCGNCGFWDFPSAFNTVIMNSDKSEVCPKCGAIGKADIYSHDFYDGSIELQCKCGHIDYIQNFVGKERWEEHIKLKREQHEQGLQDFLDHLDDYDF